jgi:hypothetical protein
MRRPRAQGDQDVRQSRSEATGGRAAAADTEEDGGIGYHCTKRSWRIKERRNRKGENKSIMNFSLFLSNMWSYFSKHFTKSASALSTELLKKMKHEKLLHH